MIGRLREFLHHLAYWGVEDKVEERISEDEEILASLVDRVSNWGSDTYIVLTDEALVYWKPQTRNLLGIGERVKRIELRHVRNLEVRSRLWQPAPLIVAKTAEKEKVLGNIPSTDRDEAEGFVRKVMSL